MMRLRTRFERLGCSYAGGFRLAMAAGRVSSFMASMNPSSVDDYIHVRRLNTQELQGCAGERTRFANCVLMGCILGVH